MGFKQKKKRQHKHVPQPAWARDAPNDEALEQAALARVIHAFALMGGTGGGAVYPCIVLHELLPGSEIMDGFGVLKSRDDESVTGCFYTAWVRTRGGRDLDPGMGIMRALNPEFRDRVVLQTTPLGQRVDVTEPKDEEGIKTNVAALHCYHDDPAKWWEAGPAPAGMTRVKRYVWNDKS